WRGRGRGRLGAPRGARGARGLPTAARAALLFELGQHRVGRAPALVVLAGVVAITLRVGDRRVAPLEPFSVELGVHLAHALVAARRPDVLLDPGRGLPELDDLPVELEYLVAREQLGFRACDTEALLNVVAERLDAATLAVGEHALDRVELGPDQRLDLLDVLAPPLRHERPEPRICVAQIDPAHATPRGPRAVRGVRALGAS